MTAWRVSKKKERKKERKKEHSIWSGPETLHLVCFLYFSTSAGKNLKVLGFYLQK